VLLEDGLIAAVGHGLEGADARAVDATDCIVPAELGAVRTGNAATVTTLTLLVQQSYTRRGFGRVPGGSTESTEEEG